MQEMLWKSLWSWENDIRCCKSLFKSAVNHNRINQHYKFQSFISFCYHQDYFDYRVIGITKIASDVTSATSYLTAQTTMMDQMVGCSAKSVTGINGDHKPDLRMLIINWLTYQISRVQIHPNVAQGILHLSISGSINAYDIIFRFALKMFDIIFITFQMRWCSIRQWNCEM